MPNLTLHLTSEQFKALREAQEASQLSDQAFGERALRSLAARYGVEFPAAAPSPVRGMDKPQPKRIGRPRIPASHPMEYDVPAGNFAFVCPPCGRTFHSDNEFAVYCSQVCKKSARNQRNYKRWKQRGS